MEQNRYCELYPLAEIARLLESGDRRFLEHAGDCGHCAALIRDMANIRTFFATDLSVRGGEHPLYAAILKMVGTGFELLKGAPGFFAPEPVAVLGAGLPHRNLDQIQYNGLPGLTLIFLKKDGHWRLHGEIEKISATGPISLLRDDALVLRSGDSQIDFELLPGSYQLSMNQGRVFFKIVEQ